MCFSVHFVIFFFHKLSLQVWDVIGRSVVVDGDEDNFSPSFKSLNRWVAAPRSNCGGYLAKLFEFVDTESCLLWLLSQLLLARSDDFVCAIPRPVSMAVGSCLMYALWCVHPHTIEIESCGCLLQSVLGSIVVSISACHAEDPGSIPGRGGHFLFSFFLLALSGFVSSYCNVTKGAGRM